MTSQTIKPAETPNFNRAKIVLFNGSSRFSVQKGTNKPNEGPEKKCFLQTASLDSRQLR